MGVESPDSAVNMFTALLKTLDISTVFDGNKTMIRELTALVNPQRLTNHPIIIQDSVLEDIYGKILIKKEQ